MPFFKFEGQRIAYTEFGGGPGRGDLGRRTRTDREERAGAATAR